MINEGVDGKGRSSYRVRLGADGGCYSIVNWPDNDGLQSGDLVFQR